MSQDGRYDLWTMTVNGSDQCRLTNHEFEEHDPRWSPAGRRIAFLARDVGVFVVEAGSVEATGEPLFDAAGRSLAFFPEDWSKDRRFLVGTDGQLAIYVFAGRSLAHSVSGSEADLWVGALRC